MIDENAAIKRNTGVIKMRQYRVARVVELADGGRWGRAAGQVWAMDEALEIASDSARLEATLEHSLDLHSKRVPGVICSKVGSKSCVQYNVIT